MTRVYRPKISRSENGDQFSQDTSPIPHPSHQSPESILAEAIMSLNSPESPQVSHSHHQNVSDSHVQLAPPYIPTDDPTNSLEQLAIDILGVLSRLPEGEKRTKHHLVTLLTQSLPITTLSTLAARIDPSLKYWYPCTHPGCFNVYSKAHNLKRHLYSHNGLRPYKCTVPGCDKSYTSADRLGTHINTHTEIRPHKCRFCEKSFVHPKSRRNHELLHGEPTYICTHVGCEKRFHRPDKLREHMKVHNRQELEDSAPLNTPLEQPSQDRRHSTLSSGSSSSLSITPKDIMALSDRSQHSDSSYMLLPRLHNHPSYVSHNTSTSTSPFPFPEHPPESTSASSSLPSSPRLEPHDSEIPDSHSHNYPQPFSTSQSDSNSPIPFYFPPQMPLPQNMPIMPLMNNNMQLNMNMFDMNNLMQMGFLEMNMNMSMIANATAAAAENNFGRDSPDNESPNDTQERRRKRKQSKT